MNLVLNYMEAKEHITIPQFFFIGNSTCYFFKINIQLIPIPYLSSKREIHSLVSILCVNHTGMLAIECYAC